MPENKYAPDDMSRLVKRPLGAIQEEFVSVAEMQRHIMPDPERLKVFGDYDIFGMTLPIEVVGGDFYDFIDLEERFGMRDRMGIVIADASGHGLVAAMLIRDFNTALYTGISFQSFYVRDTTPLLFDKINKRMFRSSQRSQFISACYGELNLDGTLRYINAGHYSPLVFKRDEVLSLDAGGPVLGAFRNPPNEYQVGEVRLVEGDVLVSFTDGIVESFNAKREEYGVERLREKVARHRERTSRQIFDAVMEDVAEFSREMGQEDDRSLVVIKKGISASPGRPRG